MIYGAEALAAFNKAKALVLAGQIEEARAVEMLSSDRTVIEGFIRSLAKRGEK